ncbi:MAG TPA: hypothetical protein VF945_01570, partial [Polyangia bacterium]
PAGAVAAGALFGVAYLAKAVLLPVGVASIVVLALLARWTSRGHARGPIARAALVLLGVALVAGLATLVGWMGPLVPVRGATAGPGPARVWFGLVGMPLFAFLLGRSLWRWAVWVRTLVGLARLRLRLAPGHPDRRAGLGFLTLPSLAFHAPFLLALSSVLCASWGAQIATTGAPLQQFRNPLIAFAAIGELLALAPLLAFTPRLFIAARAGLDDYGGLATDYVRRFRRRWMAPTARNGLLGTPDLQSLNDLGGAFRESVEKTVTLVFGLREIVVLLVVVLLPVVPLVLAYAPVEEVLAKLGKLLLGAR